MNKEMFVDTLIKLAPSIEELKKHGLPDNFINQFIGSYRCYPKKSGNINIFTNDELLLLLQSYDCSKVEIGIVSFLNEIVETENHFEIGRVEQDTLFVNKVSLEVEVLDHENMNHVIWSFASNGKNFWRLYYQLQAFYLQK